MISQTYLFPIEEFMEHWVFLKYRFWICLHFIILNSSTHHFPFLSTEGILKNKVTYPPPLVDKNMKNRLREKLSDYNQTTISSRMTSIGTNNGIRTTSDSGVTIKNPRRDQPPEQINGLAMNVHVGTVTAETSDSEWVWLFVNCFSLLRGVAPLGFLTPAPLHTF